MPRVTEFGHKNGRPLISATLTGANSEVTILSLGAITQNWHHGIGDQYLPVVLGYADPRAYLDDPYAFGAIVGRVANRTAHGRFAMAGTEYVLPLNDPPHHLHGGPAGMQHWNFALEPDAATNAVELTHVSPDRDMGYPGNVEFTLRITLTGDMLTYEMKALPDRPTPINLAQHSYYNLDGAKTCHDHRLWLAADSYTPADKLGIPTGAITNVGDGKYAFTKARSLRHACPDQLGFDVNMVLQNGRDVSTPAAIVTAGQRRLELFTDQPGLQVYDSMHLAQATGGHLGQTYRRFAGLALEPQAFPNTVNIPAFGSIIATSEQPYHQITAVNITPSGAGQ